ncbi:MAG: DUF4931 domain-containing protein [Candidatus Krumholzibacteriia bacterium]
MPEIRQNMATKEWVIIATARAKRPSEFVARAKDLTADRAERESSCPFCPGNEEPELEILRIPDTGSWKVRVVRNKYPALDTGGNRVRSFDGVHRAITGVGHHEVLIESRRHNTCPALESPEDVALMLRTFQGRGRAMAEDPRVDHVILFKNHGTGAGTSLVHPHTQIIGLPIVPHDIRGRLEEARRYCDDTGRCVFCQMCADELADGRRMVAESEMFVAFVPYAAPSPFHMWAVPRRHESDFLKARPEELADLGRILRQVLRKIYFGLNDPDYNYVVRTAPLHDAGQEYLHWYVTIIPRVTKAAGFELGSGMFINIALPEDSAEFLRSVREPE